MNVLGRDKMRLNFNFSLCHSTIFGRLYIWIMSFMKVFILQQIMFYRIWNGCSSWFLAFSPVPLSCSCFVLKNQFRLLRLLVSPETMKWKIRSDLFCKIVLFWFSWRTRSAWHKYLATYGKTVLSKQIKTHLGNCLKLTKKIVKNKKKTASEIIIK